MRNVLSKKTFSREKVHTGKALTLKIDLEKRDFIECHSFHARFVDTPQGNQNSCPIEVVQTARTKFPLAENGYPCAPKNALNTTIGMTRSGHRQAGLGKHASHRPIGR